MLKSFKIIGTESRGFDGVDAHLIHSASYPTRFQNLLRNSRYDFNVTMVHDDQDQAGWETDLVYQNRVDENTVRERFDPDYVEDPEAFNVIFTCNYADDHVPLTPWIAIHRYAHAIERASTRGKFTSAFYANTSGICEYIAQAYHQSGYWIYDDMEMIYEVVAAMTTKSSQDILKNRRMTEGECWHEILTQFIVKGAATCDMSYTESDSYDDLAFRGRVQQRVPQAFKKMNARMAIDMEEARGHTFVI